MFLIVKRFYDKGYYTKANVETFLNSGKITEEEYYGIVGMDEDEAEVPTEEV